MPIATRTFRVFVSSTFEDLKAERDALQRDVFPKLRTLCDEHGARFQAIDLRWGVRDEAALDQQTMEICLREIRRCQATGVKPNFIVLLGDRYGWQPLPPRIRADEFEALAVSTPWYKLDENADPPEYCLQPRPADLDWNPIELEIREALAKAARAAGLDPFKYEASATHQEILAGLGRTEQDRQHVFAFVRPPTADTDPRVEEMKSHLRVHEFSPEAVYGQLRKVIESEIARFADRPALDLEIEAHDRFAEDRCRIFVGREAVLKTIADYIDGPDRRPLILHGESGSGKSAVIAKASQQYKGPARMIRRFIGASPESASGHALLTSLCRQISPGGEVPVDYAQLENAFRERLKGELVIFIDALDQLSSNDPAREATWLPPECPPHVKIIVSATPEVGTAFSPFGRPEGPLRVQLEPMLPNEASEALDDLLTGALPEDAHRKLQPWQREIVLSHFNRCGLPLYLKLAAEESRLWKSYTPEAACKLGEGVAGVIDTLFGRLATGDHGQILVERSLSYLAAGRYGLTEDEVLDVLTADDIVWGDFEHHKHHEVSERRLPIVVWSRLSLDLEPYLNERAAPGGAVITFYHRQLAERVAGRFLAGAELQTRHSDLARYFSARPVSDTRRCVELVFQQRRAEQWTDAERTLFSFPFLFTKCTAGMVLDLDTDYQSLLHEAPESSLPRREALQLIHGALRLSIHVLTQHQAQFASQMVGRLLVHRDKPGVAKFVDEITAAAPRPWLRPLRPCFDPPGSTLLCSLERHADRVNGVAVTPDGACAVSASSDRTLIVWDLDTGRMLRTLERHADCVNGVAVTPDGKRAISASKDKTLKVWDLNTGRALRTLEGHAWSVEGVAVTSDGRRAVSASGDKTLKVWDLETGALLRTLEGHSDGVDAVAVLPDGKRAVSASNDKTLKVWDLEAGRVLRTLEGHRDSVFGVAVTPDGKRAASASDDKTLRVWDLETGYVLHTLEGHSDSVNGVALTPDGKRAVSASSDGTLEVWDLESGRALRTLKGHAGFVSGVAVTPDGKRAVSASFDKTLKVWDLLRMLEYHSTEPVEARAVTPDGRRAVSASRKTLKVWDLESGRVLRMLEYHSTEYIHAVAVTPDGRRAVSGSGDGTLKVWDLDTGRELRTLEGHSSWVLGVAVTSDGRRAVSASGDKTLKVWDLETGALLRTLEGHSDGVDAVAVMPDGKRAVSGSGDGTLKVWDLETGRVLRTLEGHSSSVLGVAVTPDGKRAVSGSGDGTLKVWDLETGRALRTLEGHSGPIFGVALTGGGKRAVSASNDRTLKVWDLGTGLCIATFLCAGGRFAICCAFADERRVFVGDGRVYFLALEE